MVSVLFRVAGLESSGGARGRPEAMVSLRGDTVGVPEVKNESEMCCISFLQLSVTIRGAKTDF